MAASKYVEFEIYHKRLKQDYLIKVIDFSWEFTKENRKRGRKTCDEVKLTHLEGMEKACVQRKNNLSKPR